MAGTAEAAPNDAARRLGSGGLLWSLDIYDVLVITVFGVFFAAAAQPRVDVDLGWHLRTGQLIWETGTVPHSDPFSFTVAGKPWITHEWLSEAIMFPVYAAWGFGGLILLFAAVNTVGWWFVYRHIREDGGGRAWAAGLLLLGGLTGLNLWGTRPLVFTLLLAPIYAYLLHRWWKGDRRALLPLAPLMVLWVNLHGGYMFGLGLIGLYLLGAVVSRRLGADGPRSLRPLALAGVATFLATLANPNTYQIIWYPFDTLTSAAMREYLADWPSPDFHEPRFLPFALMLALLFVAAARAGQALKPIDILLVLALAAMGLQSNRHIPLFALVATPVLSRWLPNLGTDARRLVGRLRLARRLQFANREVPQNGKTVALNCLVLLAVLSSISLKVAEAVAPEATLAVHRQYFPVDAVRYIEENDIRGRIYNAYNWGGYLVLHFYPERLVFIDSRADVYRDEFILEYLETYYVRPGWRETLQRHDVAYALIEANGPLHILLEASGEWRVLYRDEVAVLLERIDTAGRPR